MTTQNVFHSKSQNVELYNVIPHKHQMHPCSYPNAILLNGVKVFQLHGFMALDSLITWTRRVVWRFTHQCHQLTMEGESVGRELRGSLPSHGREVQHMPCQSSLLAHLTDKGEGGSQTYPPSVTFTHSPHNVYTPLNSIVSTKSIIL